MRAILILLFAGSLNAAEPKPMATFTIGKPSFQIVNRCPAAKTCHCSDACVCGCNAGEPCDCRTTEEKRFLRENSWRMILPGSQRGARYRSAWSGGGG